MNDTRMDYYGTGNLTSLSPLRRAQAARAVAQVTKKGRTLSPVAVDGRKIASTFWGKAWCDNLERYSDYANRLPRGRTYVRNGSVVDLQIAPGAVTALVSGSDIYRVQVKVDAGPEVPLECGLHGLRGRHRFAGRIAARTAFRRA